MPATSASAPVPASAPVSHTEHRRPRRAFGKDPRELAAVFLGGGIGAGIRAVLGTALTHGADSWPWATFIVNIIGVVLLAYFTTRLGERLPFTPYRRPLLGTGLCGGLTTFSTMQVEAVAMVDAGHWMLAIGYLAASAAAGLVAAHLTTQLVRRVPIRSRVPIQNQGTPS